MKNKRFVILLVVLSLFVSGCSSKYMVGSVSDGAQVVSPSYTSFGKDMLVESPAEEVYFPPGDSIKNEPDKIITTINMEFESTEFEKTLKELNELISKHNGYVSGSNIYHGSNLYGNEGSYRQASLTIRIPKDQLNTFKSIVPSIGNLTNESINKVDVTKQYTDTQSRLAVLNIKEERLLSLLNRAEKMEDIISLESELSRVIQEKESLKSTLIDLDDRIDYSTLYFQIREVRKITPQETVATSFGDKIQQAFKDSWYGFVSGIERLVINIIYDIPFIILYVGGFLIGWKVFSKFKKARIPKRERRNKEKTEEDK